MQWATMQHTPRIDRGKGRTTCRVMGYCGVALIRTLPTCNGSSEVCQRPTLIIPMSMQSAVIEPLQPRQDLICIIHYLLQLAQGVFDHISASLYRMLLISNKVTDVSNGFFGMTQRITVTKSLGQEACLIMTLRWEPRTGRARPTALSVWSTPLNQLQRRFSTLRSKADSH